MSGVKLNFVHKHYSPGMCVIAEGLWIGILLAITNAFGIASLWRGHKIHSKGLFITYFVCSIIGSVLLVLLFILSVVYSISIEDSYSLRHGSTV